MGTNTDSRDEVRALAESLDCIVDEDLQKLAKVEPGTTEAWRKRGKGPPYLILGNQILYPRKGLVEHLKHLVRERRHVPAKELL